MRLGHRYFIVLGDDVLRLSQRNHDDFYFRKLPVLPEYSGRIIDIAMVLYELENRRPSRLFQLECSRHKVTERGAIDAGYEEEIPKLIGYKLSGMESAARVAPGRATGVIDA